VRDEFAYDLEELDTVEPERYTGSTAKQNYGPLKKGARTAVLAEGKDWLLVKNDGKAIYVPKWTIQR